MSLRELLPTNNNSIEGTYQSQVKYTMFNRCSVWHVVQISLRDLELGDLDHLLRRQHTELDVLTRKSNRALMIE